MADRESEHEALQSLSRFLVGDASVRETLQKIVDLSAVAIPPATYCGITMLVDEKPATSVATDDQVARIDQAQYEADSGPCLDAFRNSEVNRIPSTENDQRWPQFSATAFAHGIRSTLSLPMRAGPTAVGALNLYSVDVDAFTDADAETGEDFAAQAAVVVFNTQAYSDARALNENLTAALESRAGIEQAKGILMSESDVGPDEAFDLLRRASQRQNRKLRDVAEEIVARRRHGERRPPVG